MSFYCFVERANQQLRTIFAPVCILIFLSASCGIGFGQTVLSLSGGSGSPGQPVTLSLSLSATGTAPSALEWTISYAASDFSGATIAVGSAGSAANKSLTCNPGVGTVKCVLRGSNSTTISNGSVATVVLTIASSTTKTSSAVAVGSSVACSGNGSALTSSAIGSTVSIVQNQTWTISGSISPAANGSGATVTLSGASTASTSVNSSGSYSFTGLSNGSYTVTPSKSGFTFSPASAQVTVNGANQAAVNFTASSTGPPLRNNLSGFGGMQFTVGSSALLVSSVGRICVAGNSGTHTVELVSVTSGSVVPGGSATVSMLNCAGGQFVYANLSSPITLQAGSSYYLVSSELSGGDQWYDLGAIPPPADVSVTNAIYSSGSGWVPGGGANMSYVPPSFQYTVANTSMPQFVTGFNTGAALRNNLAGYVGMQLTVGSKPLTMSSVGRACVSGNSQSHVVEFVNASTGTAVSGGSATVSMSGCQAGQFVFAALNPSITLPAGGSYYLVSLESYGGDQWHDLGSITTTSVATVSNAVYSSGSGWNSMGAANTSYGPVSFQYNSASVQFVTTDIKTQGNWQGVYGSQGSVIIGDSSHPPSDIVVTPSGSSLYTWASSTSDVRALERQSSGGRIASTWYGGTFSIDLNATDGTTHQFALYCLDWDDAGPRAEQVQILDAGTNAVLDTRNVTSFVNGQYLVWNIAGHVVVRVTVTNGANAVVSGLFWDGGSVSSPPPTGGSPNPPPVGNSAQFVAADTTTEGNWRGVYGGAGATVIGDTSTAPSFATVTPNGASTYTWQSSTVDPRALWRLNGSSRIAGTLYNSVFTLNVAIQDGNTHQLSLYCLDWDAAGPREERIDILDASTGNVLDSRTVTSFIDGEYLTWNISGNVTVRVTDLQGANAVVSGLFWNK